MMDLQKIIVEVVNRFVGCEEAVKPEPSPSHRAALLVQCQQMWLQQLLAIRQVVALEQIAALLAVAITQAAIGNDDLEEDDPFDNSEWEQIAASIEAS